MAPHWKCGSGQPVAGSNPALSATYARAPERPGRRWPDRSSLTQTSGRWRRGGSASDLGGRWPAPGLGLPVREPVRSSAPPCPGRPCARAGTIGGSPERPARRWRAARPFPGECRGEALAVDFRGRARRGTSGALYLQSAPAGLNSLPRSPFSDAAASSDVEDRVPRSGDSRTVSGPEGSSTQRSSSGAAERPGPSRSLWWARGRDGRRRVHGNRTRARPSTGVS